MREYKFRAWHAHTGNMLNNDIIYKLIEGDRIVLADQNIIKKEKLRDDYLKSKLAPEHWRLQGNPFNNCDLEIMQFIDHKDKNGKEIYKDDIIKCNFGIGIIIYNKGQCAFKIKWITSVLDDEESWIPFKGFKSKEVIGNIYENPELIKV